MTATHKNKTTIIYIIMNFDKLGSPEQEGCYIQFKDLANSRMYDYNMYNNYDPYCKSNQREEVQNFAAENQRHYKEGFGEPIPCVIDQEPQLSGTRDRVRNQLCTRVFLANPNLGRGIPMPEIESQLTQGESTYEKKQCTVSDYCGVDAFVPLIPCVENMIHNKGYSPNSPPFPVPTRDLDKQADFFKKRGYKLEGNIWIQKECDTV